jgi:hypothetical protein
MKIRIQSLAVITSALLAFALLPIAQAVVPPPDGGYPGFNTAEGRNALSGLTTGIGNTAVGWFSLFSNNDGSFNTAVGAGTLLFNLGNQASGEGTQNKTGELVTVRYDAVNAMLLNEFLKEHRRVAELEATVVQQRKDFQVAIARLRETVSAQLREQTSQIQKVSAEVATRSTQQMFVENP